MSDLPLSVAIVCKDNETTIGRTLASIAPLASEIVAVDSGSTDQTIPLLEKHHARVVRSDWKGFVATKQMALELCTNEWVLCVDSDESVLPSLAREIERVVRTPVADGYEVNRKVFYRGRALNHVWQPEWRLRLVRKGRFAWGGLDPHDQLRPVAQGPVVARLQGDLRHDSIEDFATFLSKQSRHAATMARSMQAEGRRGSVFQLATSPAGAFFKQLVLKQGWRDGWIGWASAASTGISTAMKHAILLDLTRKKPTDPES